MSNAISRIDLTPPGPRLVWRDAAVTDTIDETATARTIVLDIPEWAGHRAGQHVDIRLTADDGYQATRSYSLSSGAGEEPQITVERVDDGEVSPFMVDIVEVGDTFEVRGPIGGYFVWDRSPEPLLLIGGGSGIAPLRAMWRTATDETPITILYSARSRSRVIYEAELRAHRGSVQIHLTRESAPGFADGRIRRDHLASAVRGGAEPQAFVCGPTAFVESALTELSTLIDDPRRIRAERFG